MIVSEYVVWIRDPEGSWSLISVQKTPGSFCEYSKISVKQAICLDSILDEECVSHVIISYIIENLVVMNSVDCERTIVCLVNCVTDNL